MLDIHELGFGAAGPVLAALFAVAGCLLGVLLVSRARRLDGRVRLRLLAYAVPAIAVVGVWLSQFVALLGLTVPDVPVRYDLGWSLTGLLVALTGIGGGVYVLRRRALTRRRLAAGGAMLGGGALGTQLVGLLAVQLPASLRIRPASALLVVVAAIAGGMLVAVGAAAVRTIRQTLLAGVVVGIAVYAGHYLMMSTVDVVVAAHPVELTGFAAGQLLPLTVSGGFGITVMLWYFSVGNATRRLRTPPGLPSETSNILLELTSRLHAPARPGTGSGRPGMGAGRPAPTPIPWTTRSIGASTDSVATGKRWLAGSANLLGPGPVLSGQRRQPPVRPRPRPSTRPDRSRLPTWGEAASAPGPGRLRSGPWPYHNGSRPAPAPKPD